MHESELPLLDDDATAAEPFSARDLGIAIDLTREDLEDTEDGLGFRSLLERPDRVLRRARRSRSS